MNIIPITQIILSVALIVLILMQQNEAGIGASFGGGDAGGMQRTRRGAERSIFFLTIAIAIAYAVLAVVSLVN